MQKSGNRNSDGRDGNVNVNISGGKGKYGRLTKTSPRPPPPTTTSPNNRSLGKINITNKKAKKTKVVPKSKHHTIAKPTKRKYSINNRVAAVKANKSAAAAATGKSASAKPKPKKKNASSSWNESGGGKRRSTNGIGMAISSGGPIRKSNNDNNSRSSNSNNNFRSTVGTNYSKNNNSNKLFRGRRRTNYQMRLPGSSNSNNNIHFKYLDVPWFDAELQERFSDNHALTTMSSASTTTTTTTTNIAKSSATPTMSSSTLSSSSSSVAVVEAKLLPRLPSESILQSIDDELHSFSVYVRLTHTERQAREHFLHHVAEQASSAALVLPSSNNNSMNGANYYNRNNVVGGSGGRGGGDNGGGGGRAAAARERIRVIPFGSFATQEVCCFASDVDMCLWGVVECEQTPSATTTATSVDCNRDSFIGNTTGAENDDYTREDDANNDDNGGGDVETDGDGCPLLTESSLLRTMDAIQSASASAAAVAAVAFDDGTSTEVSTSAATCGGKGTDERKQQQPQSDNINHEVDECLFFIDREGEAAGEGADSNDIESIHQSGFKDSILSTIHVEEHENTHELVAANDSASASSSVEGIHFEVDGKGMKELGGCSGGGDVEVIDLTASDDAVVDDGKVSDVKSKDQQAQREKAGDARRQTYTKEENGGLPERGEDSIIEIDDDSDDDSSEVVIANQCVNQDDGNDSDSADKMSSYYRRQDPTSEVQSGRMESQASPIALLDDDSSASSSSSADLDDDCSSSDSDYEPFHSSKIEVMELSLTSNIGHNGKVLSGNGGVQQHTKNVVMGPKGKARNQVVSALVSLTRQLRRSNFTHTIECRKGARVPIINCSTRTGFEGDIAIGGHNGVDTSMYAMSQVKRFRSFAPIVLLLKIILAQQGLDKPFTGGLGSYRLYVLAALAIERHLANGGNDRPSEMLISLLFRYGCIESPQFNQFTVTDLESLREKKKIVSCDGGTCDLELVFRIGDCVDTFRECHERLFARVQTWGDAGSDNNERVSFLSSIIDCFRLRDARETSDRRSKMCDTDIGNTPVARNDPGKVNGGRRIGKVFSKSDGPENWKRGPRGGIIPRKRPDLEAKNSNRNVEFLQRATKNRKNNKKQKRDVAFKEFASSQLLLHR